MYRFLSILPTILIIQALLFLTFTFAYFEDTEKFILRILGFWVLFSLSIISSHLNKQK